MKSAVYLTLGFGVSLLLFSRFLPHNPSVLGTSTLSPSKLASLANLARLQHQLPPLVLSPSLNQAAQNKAVDMLARGYWSHATVTDKTPWYFIDAVGYAYLYAGENLARDFTSEAKVIEAWLNSPTHRDNLLNPNFSELGLGIISGVNPNGRETVIIVLLLAQPAQAPINNPSYTSSSVLPPQLLNPSVSILFYLTLSAAVYYLMSRLTRHRPSLDRSLWHH